jgi:hypothetical protein
MGEWSNDPDIRQTATRIFCEMLDADPALREKCKADPAAAKETLKKAGNFTDIPADVIVYVMEDKLSSSDKIVAMVLPEQGKVPDAEHFELKSVWRCTWSVYLQ